MAQGLFSSEKKSSIESGADEAKKAQVEKTEGKPTRPTTKTGLTQRAYYITEEQYKTLKFMAVEKSTDTSSIVREALDSYFTKA